jgi:hypothetical protein
LSALASKHERLEVCNRLAERLHQLTGIPADLPPAAQPTVSVVSPAPWREGAPRTDFRLTVHLVRRGDVLEASYALPGRETFGAHSRAWAALERTWTPLLQTLVAADPETAAADLTAHRIPWGEALFELLFGDVDRWEPVLCTLFDRQPPTPRPNPGWQPVRLRICADEPVLLALPW